MALSRQRVGATLLEASGLLALVLAAMGIFATTVFSVSQRTHEIGLRMALGAQRHNVMRLVAFHGLLPTFIGLVVGLVASMALMQFIRSFLFGVSATDSIALAASAALLVMVAALACYLPARRASKVDPMVALRHE